MARRRDENIVDVLFDVSAMLPWWVGVIAAAVTYFVCHSFATADIVAAKNLNEFGSSAAQTIIKVIASFAQFVLPIIFLAGAAASAFAQVKRGRRASAMPDAPGGSLPFQPYRRAPGPEHTWPDQHGADIYPMWKSEAGESVPSPQVDATCWSAQLLSALEWKRFEQVCAGLFERLGFDTRTTTKGADGGVDIHLFRRPGEQAVAIVQCKAWTGSSKVGVRYIRELHGVMASKRINDGIFATTTIFSDDAKEYAKANHIDLMDRDTILKSISTLTTEQQASLLQFATAGDYATPTCPSCGVKMTRRNPKAGGKPFWGCVYYPRCHSIINIAKT